MTSLDHQETALELVEAAGPGPFETRRVYRRPDGSVFVWESRDHRKHLSAARRARRAKLRVLFRRSVWNPGHLNWWIGIVFALGSALFMLGSLLILVPELAERWSVSETGINAVFFIGSIPFTTAAYLQLFQAANAGHFGSGGRTAPGRTVRFGWRPHDIGWLSCALQFAGTVLFNFNTFDAMLPHLTWLEQDLAIWVPNMAGSILFIASAHLAIVETGHSYMPWRPQSLSWWVTLANYLGCIGFMISAIYAVALPAPAAFDAVTISVLFTLIGAAGFLIGSLLMLPETAIAGE